MTDIPAEALAAAEAAIRAELSSSREVEPDALARAALEAAAPILAEAWGVNSPRTGPMTGGYVPKVHVRIEPGAGLARCGLGGRTPRLTDDRAEATCAACCQGWQARTEVPGE